MSDFNLKSADTQQDVANYVTGQFKNLSDTQGFKVPEHYSVANALQEAVAMLPTISGIDRVSADSVRQSLFNMVVQGLSPAKTQVYFIAYGNQLQMQRSYFGTQQVLKRLPEIKDIYAMVVHEEETFEVDYNEAGDLTVVAHHTDFSKLDNPIIGAYAKILLTDGDVRFEVMTKKQIDNSWSQSKSKNVQNKFPEEMAKRTVINRAAKNIINTSQDSGTLVGAINKTTENEYDYQNTKDVTPENKPTSEEIENFDKDDYVAKRVAALEQKQQVVHQSSDDIVMPVDEDEPVVNSEPEAEQLNMGDF